MGELAVVSVLAHRAVTVEGGAGLKPGCEVWEGHQADAVSWVRGVIALDVAYFRCGIARFDALVGVCLCVALGGAALAFAGLAGDGDETGDLPQASFLPHAFDLVELTLLGACEVEGGLHDAFAALS